MNRSISPESFARVALGGLLTVSGCATPPRAPEHAQGAIPPLHELSLPPAPIVAHLKPVTPFGARVIGSWAPYTTEFSHEPPSSLRVIPPHSESAVFGEFPFGHDPHNPRVRPMVGWMLDEEREQFIVDENRNFILTDDIPASWCVERRPTRDGKGTFGVVTVRADIAASTDLLAPVWSVALFFDERSSREERHIEFSIDRYRDAVVRGPVMFGDKVYEVIVDDGGVSGDFSYRAEAPRDDLSLRIDVNRNGSFGDWGEEIPLTEPFRLNGVTYEVESLTEDGQELVIRHSDLEGVELVPAPDLRPGALAPSFSVRAEDGRVVNFPQDFAGKVVLLDLWASWCGPCIAEIPNLKSVYEQYHDRGFEILSVSIDEGEVKRERARALVAQHEIPWNHAFDSGGWSGEIVSKFAPGGIPAFYLVDGSTGQVLGSLYQIRESRLAPRVEQALRHVGR